MNYAITSGFGIVENVRNGRPHMGIDLAIPKDTPLRSFCDGVVEKVVNYGNTNIGKGVIIKAKDGVRYIYGHMDQVDVFQGDKVQAGTLLGLSGDTGHAIGAHLHFGEMVNGKFVDPSNVIKKVDGMAGWSTAHTTPTDNLGWATIVKDVFFDPEALQDHMQLAIMGALSTAGAVCMHLLFAGTLVGAGILIVLKQLGFEHRWLRPSVLIGAYVILRFVFGG